MRKLYLKIVLAIWSVMIVSALVVAIVVRLASQGDMSRLPNIEAPPWEMIVPMIVDRALAASAGGGQAALIRWFENEPMLSRAVNVELMTAAGQVLLAPARPRAGQNGGDDRPAPRRVEFEHEGSRYILVLTPRAGGHLERPSRLPRVLAFFMFRPEYRWLLLAIAVPLTAVLSLLIARYLTSPLRSFELAGKALASGELSARVAPTLGNRGDEIADFAAAFDDMAVRIEALVKSHKVLLRDVSHEIRSPLARAQAAVSLARQRSAGVVDRELDRIEYEIERLDRMIGRLLEFARLDARQVEAEKLPLRIDNLLAEVVAEASIEARSAGKRIHLDVADSLCIDGDAELLRSSLENVVRNAVRHTPEGSTVEISLRRSAGTSGCRIDVRDHGSGVADADLERIFDPFFRSDEARGPHTGGTGIGLAIAEKAIRLHNGSISAANAADGGLRVTVRLPA